MWKRQMTKLLMGFSVLVSIISVNGADFKPDRTLYVSIKGSDANDGLSEKTAFKTIGKAAEIVKPGDLVIVKGGKYQEQVTLDKSGTEEKPIVFRATPNETVVVTWGWDIDGWKKVDGRRFIYESSFPYAINILWERKTLSRYLELESMDLLDKQPGGFVVDKKTGKIFLHSFDGGNPEFAGITAVPFTDAVIFTNGKSPLPYSKDSSKSYRWTKGFLVKGSYNIVDGFELAFFPTGMQIRDAAKGCTARNNIVYGTTTGIATHCTVGGHLLENNRAYKSSGPGIILGGENKDIIVRNNYLFNNGHCPPFWGQDNGSGGHPYNLAQYGGKDVLNVSFIDNMVISDDPSRRVGVMRCKGGINGNMDVSGNVFVGGGPHFYPQPDSKAIISNNTVVGGEINYTKLTSDNREYKPELIANLCLKNTREKPCFADPSFYDYHLRKDSPFIGGGAYPKAGQILYVDSAAKEEGDGSAPEKALKSLSEAFGKAVSGTSVYILPGKYRENLSLSKKENITIRNYGKGKVIFEASQFTLKECQNLNIDGVIFKNSKIQLQNSNCMEFLHCVFDGNESGVKAENCGLIKIINDTFISNVLSADIVNASAIFRNNLFIDCKPLPVKSEATKTISENNVFSGENAEKMLTEWKNKYSETIPSFASNVKLENNYVLPNDTKLAYSGLGWTFIGARGAENKNRPIVVEGLKASNILSDRVILQWETPFDYPNANIVCKDKSGKTIFRIPVRQGEYKQTVNSECIKGLVPNSLYNIILSFTNPGAADKVEKTLSVTTTAQKEFMPKTIYVSKSGDNAKNGFSAKDAKKSISAALGIALPGDTILVAPGIYSEQNNIDIDGISKDKRFILKSEKPGKAVLSANYVFDSILRVNQGKYITIDGFKFSGLRYSAIVIALTISNSEGITVRNCIFDRDWKKKEGGGCSNLQLKCVNVNDIEISNCIFDSGFQGIWMTSCDKVRIFNNTFWHTGINGIHAGCKKDADVKIYSNIFEDVVANHKSPALSTGEYGKKIFCDYNIYWKNDSVCPGQKIYGAGGGEKSATWSIMKKDMAETIEDARKMYGVEMRGQFADPLLKDPRNGDFSAKPGSPAIGKGKNGSNIGVDMSVFLK